MAVRRPLVRIDGENHLLPAGDTITGAAGGCTSPAYPALKASIVLFDFNPGTRSWTVPEGVSQIRAFVVGAGSGGTASASGSGGGYAEKIITVTAGSVISYTVGVGGVLGGGSPGGTSSFGGVISATGGSTTAAGVGSGGDINTSGGAAAGGAQGPGGGAAHAFGDGSSGTPYFGGGFAESGRASVDGWKIGLLPGADGYGCGGSYHTSIAARFPGLGGGAGNQIVPAGVGGGAAGAVLPGGHGLVGIEVIA